MERGAPLDLLVVGGGISGLTLAREARRLKPDWQVRVLEAGSVPGGTMRSERVDGCLCECGPNGFLTNVPYTWDLARELGLGSRLRVADASAKRRFLWVRDELKEISANPLAFLRADILSVRGRLRLLLEPFMRAARGDDVSVRAFASRRIGAEAADVLVDAMVSGIHAGDPAQLSLKAAFPRMAEMEARHGSLTRAMLALSRERRKNGDARTVTGGPAGPGGTLTSFDEGMGVLIGALAQVLGRDLLTGAPVSGIGKANDGSFAVHGSHDGRPLLLGARRLVLATPAYTGGRLLATAFPQLADCLDEIVYAPISVVCLVYDRKRIEHDLNGFGFLVPRGQGPRLLGCIWTGSIFPDHVPRDRVLLRVMVGGSRDPASAALEDATLVDLVTGELERILGRIDGPPRRVQLYRWPQGIPQYRIGHLDRMERIDRELGRSPGLYLAGNAYRGISVNDCVREARALAGRIAAQE